MKAILLLFIVLIVKTESNSYFKDPVNIEYLKQLKMNYPFKSFAEIEENIESSDQLKFFAKKYKNKVYYFLFNSTGREDSRYLNLNIYDSNFKIVYSDNFHVFNDNLTDITGFTVCENSIGFLIILLEVPF